MVTRKAYKKATEGFSEHSSGFMDFIREQGVVGLAVGLAIGAAAGNTVKQLVESFINPIVKLIVGSQEGLQKLTLTVNIGGRSADFAWGAFVSSLITLIAVAAVVYMAVHFLQLNQIDKKKEDK